MGDFFKRAIVVVIAAAVLAGVGYLAWLNHNHFEKAMLGQAEAQLLITAKSEAQSIENYIANIHQELQILSSEFVICRIIRGKYNRADNPEYCAAMENSYKDVEKLVDSIYLIDSAGEVVNISPFKEGVVGTNLNGLPDVKEGLKNQREYTSPVFKTASGELAVALIHPVFENSQFLGLLRAVLPVQRIDGLISHINQGKIYALLIDDNNVILSSPEKSYIGREVSSIFNAKYSAFNQPEFKDALNRMNAGGQGAQALLAFAPIRFGSNLWSIVVAADYALIAGPIHKNARDNLILVGLLLTVFIYAGVTFYKIQKKRAEIATSAQALDIINKQLHLEIDERKRLEQALGNYVNPKRLRRE